MICPESPVLKNIKYDNLWEMASKTNYTVQHYCVLCNHLYPSDPDIFQCNENDCEGLRYKGPYSSQMKANRQPRCYFIIADIGAQLKNILERKGVWSLIEKSKLHTRSNQQQNKIADITDGEFYRKLSQPGQFLFGENNISTIFNTDGVPLYTSTGVKLWPVFLAINELPPGHRFSRDNMILAGIWQGKNAPPFREYMNAIGVEIGNLYNNGLVVDPHDEKGQKNVKVAIILGSMDLQAKAYVMNMTMHNGESGCITCKEKGLVVKQGKGHARCYPYRPPGQREDMRTTEGLICAAAVATRSNRVDGICGQNGLALYPELDLVTGLVPDYMHGVLLGVTKNLMYKWFSATQSKQPFFVGKRIKEISKRLQHIQPPDYIERLPRDLEKHYNHFKATELQSWLLFYSLPCLNGILPQQYLKHFACLSEAIHILLRDNMSLDDLHLAEKHLDVFYRDFENLYGRGSCGLNVHNIGYHLVYYVRQWGPLFGWSCFGFEDWNASLLQSVHGSGDVTRQLLVKKDAQAQINAVDCGNWSNLQSQFFFRTLQNKGKAWKSL
ncbi:uncharacterized protein [Ptychodera flava]|uniref:uncharacterized protein n=1 Tax=Ptychodera flava TaxID=63121 RepID=UPI00396A77D1